MIDLSDPRISKCRHNSGLFGAGPRPRNGFHAEIRYGSVVKGQRWDIIDHELVLGLEHLSCSYCQEQIHMSITNVNLPDASFQQSMDEKAVPETDVAWTPMEKLSSSGDAYPRPDRSVPSSVQARDGDPEKAAAGLASSHREIGVREDKDQNIINWDGPDDPHNPVNWSARKKWTNVMLLAAMTLLT